MGGNPNHFVEKIWGGLIGELDDKTVENWIGEDGILDLNFGNNFKYGWPHEWSPKIHTIRHDPHDRWKPGMKIHPVIYNRTPRRFQFAPTIVCTGVQKIWIDREATFRVMIKGDRIDVPWYRSDEEIKALTINDGFDSTEQFFEWFDKPAQLKIIHWTNFKY